MDIFYCISYFLILNLRSPFNISRSIISY